MTDRILIIVNGVVLGSVGSPAAADRWRELFRRAGLRVEVCHG